MLSNKAVNTARVGYASYGINQSSLTTWSHHWQAANGITNGGPNITFRGFRSNRNGNIPRYRNQNTYTIHDDFTYSYDVKGHHDLKAGGEYLHLLDNTRNCNQCGGTATRQRRAGSGQHHGAASRIRSTRIRGSWLIRRSAPSRHATRSACPIRRTS